MAVYSNYYAFGEQACVNFTLATVTASAERTDFGPQELIAITSDQDLGIRFGAPGNVATPSATDFPIWAKTTLILQVDRNFTSYKLFNKSGSTANIFIQRLNPRA